MSCLRHRVYEASKQSRLNILEIIAVLRNGIRKLRILQGAKAAVGRKNFTVDLEMLATASSEDLMQAMNIASPKESIGTACCRQEMPAKVQTALRTLLLSTSDVPGTEGRKTQL